MEIVEADPVKPAKRKKAPTFAPIKDARSARSAAKSGAIAGAVFAGMYIVGILLLTGFHTPSPLLEPDSEFQYHLQLGIDAAAVGLILFLSWRVYTGRGYISASVLLVWFVGEIAFKVLTGATNFVWVLVYIAMLIALAEGVRGCWLGRRYRDAADPATFD
jgi:hypothetical protein